MANVYFKGNRVWHETTDNQSECVRCGFKPMMDFSTVETKADTDPNCKELPAAVKEKLKKS